MLSNLDSLTSERDRPSRERLRGALSYFKQAVGFDVLAAVVSEEAG